MLEHAHKNRCAHMAGGGGWKSLLTIGAADYRTVDNWILDLYNRYFNFIQLVNSFRMILSKLNKDFSPFFLRENHVRTRIPNSVIITIGEEIIECNGLVLAGHSKVLRELLFNSYDLYFDEFCGDRTGVEDCLDLMYGGEVEIDEGNIQVLIKFGKLFEVDDMVQGALDWLSSNITMENLGVMIKVGFYINDLQEPSDMRVLSLCKTVMVKALDLGKMTDLSHTLELLLTGEMESNCRTIDFFLSKQLLEVQSSILPLLTDWIDSASKSTLILTCISSLDLYDIFQYNEGPTTSFLEKLGDHIDDLSAAKILNKLHLTTMKQGFKPTPIKQEVTTLSGPELSMLPDELRHSLSTDEHFIYVEKMLSWVQVNEPPKSVINFLWSTITQKSLSYEYVKEVKDQLCRDGAEIPKVTDLGKYKFTSTTWNSDYVSGVREGLVADHHTAELVTELCTVKDCNLHKLHVRVLKLQDTTPCYSLDERALVKTVGHTHPNLIEHWYIRINFMNERPFMSLVTHSLQEVVRAVRSVNVNFTVHCLEEQQYFK